ncbi:SRPBCC family protein [Pendulispora rubella]|uniref:SRPBCC family protein n=1 Tax=Pendulispora rubella TaxID=2741070 RepID=A0ABZ2L3Q7_9BACT
MTTDAKRNGRVIVDDGFATLSFERRLLHPIEDVWTAITDPDERRAWLGETHIEPRVGGAVKIVAHGPPVPPEVRTLTGRVLVWDPPHVLEHTWDQKIIGETIARYELSRDGDATLLRFTHRGFRVRAHAGGYGAGMHAYFERLDAYLANEPLPDWASRSQELAPIYA